MFKFIVTVLALHLAIVGFALYFTQSDLFRYGIAGFTLLSFLGLCWFSVIKAINNPKPFLYNQNAFLQEQYGNSLKLPSELEDVAPNDESSSENPEIPIKPFKQLPR